MSRVALALLVVALAAPAARADDLTLGVFLPNAAFATNAERSAYAERLAAAVAAELGPGDTVRGQAFARREDLGAFLNAGKVDLLVTDPLFQVGRSGLALAQALDASGRVGPRAALYALPGTRGVLALQGRAVALARAGDRDARFFAATALEGEVDPARLFGPLREAKDVQAALGAVKANVAAAAFAPEGHPDAAGLEVLAAGRRMPLAVLVAPSSLPERVAEAAVKALVGGAGRGGGIAAWQRGAAEALQAASAGRAGLDVLTELPVLTPERGGDVALPRIRLETSGRLPAMSTADIVLEPTLPE